MTTPSLLVAEIFGPTFQGEGPSTGQQAAFLRLSRCNLTCTWCDTPYTWDWTRFDPAKESERLSNAEILRRLEAIAASIVVITGGEPLLQQRHLEPLVAACRDAGRSVEVETNGTVAPEDALVGSVTRFNVSPKLANSRVPRDRRINPGALERLAATGKAAFKFVVEDVADLDEVSTLEAQFGLKPIWIMPQGETSDAVLKIMRDLADDILARGWNLTTRLHVLLWDAARGR